MPHNRKASDQGVEERLTVRSSINVGCLDDTAIHDEVAAAGN
jgi:hypothetical protein